MATYTWLTKTDAITALQGRLQSDAFWTDSELFTYLTEALRVYNALTEQWVQDFVFTSNSSTWNNSGTMAGSPRLRTVTDAYIYSQMQMMLQEPVTGAGTWTGTSQFNLGSLQYSLQKRRDEMIQLSACNLVQLAPMNTTPGTRRNLLPDTVLEPRRIRFLGDFPITLTREDTQAFQFFEPDYLQTDSTPQSWGVASEPPLAFDVDTAPNTSGVYEVIALQSGPTFAPPAATLLGVPDDWSWVAMYGALADLLNSESERTDRSRAAYCLDRYTKGCAMMLQANWLKQANINGVPVDTPSVFEADSYDPTWQTNTNAFPTVVQAGMDFFAVAPAASASVNVTLIGNIPIPASGGDFLQISRDAWQAVLNYAVHLASWKHGGAEFQATMPLYMDFLQFAAGTNKRLLHMGIFTDKLNTEGKREDTVVPRQ